MGYKTSKWRGKEEIEHGQIGSNWYAVSQN